MRQTPKTQDPTVPIMQLGRRFIYLFILDHPCMVSTRVFKTPQAQFVMQGSSYRQDNPDDISGVIFQTL